MANDIATKIKATKPLSHAEMAYALQSIKPQKEQSTDEVSWLEAAVGTAAAVPQEFWYGASTTYEDRMSALEKRKVTRLYNQAKLNGLI